MAEALTYDSLLSDVLAYCERSDAPFSAQVPRFVMLAENKLASEVRGLGFQKYVTGAMNGATLPKPARWRETVSFNVTVGSNRVFLQPRTYDYCRAYSPDPSATGVPRFYADYEYEHYLIVPTPAANYAFELSYYERPQPLDANNQTSWTTQYAPQLLLYATLLEAQPFLKRPDLQGVWQAAYDRALQGLAQESTRRIGADRAASARNGE